MEESEDEQMDGMRLEDGSDCDSSSAGDEGSDHEGCLGRLEHVCMLDRCFEAFPEKEGPTHTFKFEFLLQST